jgi:hypothetical protein
MHCCGGTMLSRSYEVVITYLHLVSGILGKALAHGLAKTLSIAYTLMPMRRKFLSVLRMVDMVTLLSQKRFTIPRLRQLDASQSTVNQLASIGQGLKRLSVRT